MARKRAKKVTTTQQERVGRPVRLDLTEEVHDRLERQASKLGLSKASYARMAVMERLQADEEKE
jgi:hypothetical protein